MKTMEVTNINVANATKEKIETLRGLYAIDLKTREYSRVTAFNHCITLKEQNYE